MPLFFSFLRKSILSFTVNHRIIHISRWASIIIIIIITVFIALTQLSVCEIAAISIALIRILRNGVVFLILQAVALVVLLSDVFIYLCIYLTLFFVSYLLHKV